MKFRVILFFLCVTGVLLLTYTASHAQTVKPDSTAISLITSYIPSGWFQWIALIYGIYELAVLFLPSSKNASLIGNILSWFVKGGNRTK